MSSGSLLVPAASSHCLTNEVEVEEANIILISPSANCIPMVLFSNTGIHGLAPFLIFSRAGAANFHGLYTALPSCKFINAISVDVIVFLIVIGFLVWVRVTGLLGF